jgi:hypothetical protein
MSAENPLRGARSWPSNIPAQKMQALTRSEPIEAFASLFDYPLDAKGKRA